MKLLMTHFINFAPEKVCLLLINKYKIKILQVQRKLNKHYTYFSVSNNKFKLIVR